MRNRARPPLARAIRTLTEAGILVSVSVAPIIPLITEPDTERILEAANAAGVVGAHFTVLRIPRESVEQDRDPIQAGHVACVDTPEV